MALAFGPFSVTRGVTPVDLASASNPPFLNDNRTAQPMTAFPAVLH